MKQANGAFLGVVAILLTATHVNAGQLAVGSANTQPGQTVSVSVTYTAEGKTAVALASDVRFNTAIFKNPRCENGSALGGDKSVRCGTPKPGILRLAIFGLNTNPVAAGEVAKIVFDVAPAAKAGRYTLRHKPTAADKDGNDFKLTHSHGVVHVGKI